MHWGQIDMCQRLCDIPIPNFLEAPKCCTCETSLAGRVHLVYLDYRAEWITPAWHDTGSPAMGAVAVVCSTCYRTRRMGEIKFALERRAQNGTVEVVYHEVESLLPLPIPTMDN